MPAAIDTTIDTPRTDTFAAPEFVARCRLATRLLIGFLAMSVLLAIATFLLRDHVRGAVWIRVSLLLVASPLYLWIANRMAAGRRWAYVRLRLLSIFGAAGIALLVTLPGPYPGWMRAEQAVQGLILLALAIVVSGRAVRSRFAKPVEPTR